MHKRISWFAIWMFFTGVAFGQEPATSTSKPKPSKPSAAAKASLKADAAVTPKPTGIADELRAFFDSFAGAFKKGDGKAVASHFASNGMHEIRTSGTRTVGRDAIEQLYKDVFQPGRAKSVDLSMESVRQVTPDVAVVRSNATVARAGGPPVRTAMEAMLVKRDGKWQLDSVEEFPGKSVPHPFDQLQSLAWMVGEWRDEDGKKEITTQCEWSDDYSFLNRKYTVYENGKKLHEGTQKIGFDAVDGLIRSWAFESDGSFGDGVWKFDGQRWTVNLTGRTPQGLNVSATQIITPKSVDSYTTQLVSREIGGKLLPNEPVINVLRATK